MHKIYKVAIIGGGASGLLCAAELLKDGVLRPHEVVILEKNDRVAKKLIATGNGQCNLSNRNISVGNYHGNKDFICEFFENNGFGAEEYLKQLGIFCLADDEGRVYPISKQASAVSDILRAFLNKFECDILTSFEVDNIKKSTCFSLYQKDGNEVIYAEKVVFAAGGACGKQFGTDGSAYTLAKRLGHNLTPIYPSLVQLKTETSTIRSFIGLKERATVNAYDNKILKSTATGDLLFTNYGVSGNSVFAVSSGIAEAKDPNLVIEFLPDYSETDIYSMLKTRLSLGILEPLDCLSGLINKRIGQTLIKSMGKITAEGVAHVVKNFSLKVTGTLGFDYAQATHGGINAAEINSSTMESRLISGLYFIGEALDVDGDCGGYNLTFAFLSGIAAARAIKSALKA